MTGTYPTSPASISEFVFSREIPKPQLPVMTGYYGDIPTGTPTPTSGQIWPRGVKSGN